MIDFIDIAEDLQVNTYLRIKFRYKLLKHIVADKYGNLFILPHCPYKRTIELSQLSVFDNMGKKAIKYHGSNVSFKQLKKFAYEVSELIFWEIKKPDY